MTFDPEQLPLTLNITCKTVKWDMKSHFWPGDLELQGPPLTLTQVTFALDPCDPWPQRLLVPVRWSNETRNNGVFLPGDLDLWTSRSNLGSMFWPNFMTLSQRYEFWLRERHTYIIHSGVYAPTLFRFPLNARPILWPPGALNAAFCLLLTT